MNKCGKGNLIFRFPFCILSRNKQRRQEEKMYLIAGLGNPTKKYEKTRHNAGFEVIDYLSEKYQIPVKQAGFKGLYGTGYIEGQKVLLLKPQTYMNLSGESIRAALDFYKMDPEEEMVVIYDDISLAPGQLRVRAKGSAGGHNGMKNIILHTGTQKFARVRVGVGEKPKDFDLADYVLGHFSEEDQKIMDEAFQKAGSAAAVIVTEGTDAAMNQFNGK